MTTRLRSAAGRESEAAAIAEQAARMATEADDQRTLSRAVAYLADAFAIGAEPVGPAIERVEADLARIGRYPASWHETAGALAMLHAMAGHRDRSLELLRDRDTLARERGFSVSGDSHYDGYIAMSFDDPSLALGRLAEAFEQATTHGDTPMAGVMGFLLMESLLTANRIDDAIAIDARVPSPTHMLDSVVDIDSTRSRLALVRGDRALAIAHAEAAIANLEGTDWLQARGYAWWRLAEARDSLGERAGAREAAATALACFHEKGDVTSAAKVRRLLERLTAAS